jgi:hypothetical protein
VDTTELEAGYRELLEAAGAGVPAATSGDAWNASTVLAHVIASSRMLAAASAELLAGRIPVVDNRPTQSRRYLDAIVSAADGDASLVDTVRRSGQELVTLASQLDDKHIGTDVPTIILDNGRIRIQRPVPFSALLGPAHLREHLEQLCELLR